MDKHTMSDKTRVTGPKENHTMRLVDITSENWEDVIFLTTNQGQ